ncbi:MAG: hypothetical protein C4346_15605, partial [Chloroflexota bacterium]
ARVDRRLQRALARFPDLIIANSQAGRNHAVGAGFPAGRLIVVPNGIDTERFAPQPELGLPLRQAWGVGDGERLIGRVGRLLATLVPYERDPARPLSRNWRELVRQQL